MTYSVDPVAEFDYDAYGRAATVTFADGVTENNAFDADRGWLTSREYKDGSNNTLFKLENLTFDNAGKITSQRYQHDNAPGSPVITANYGYDDLNRLTSFNNGTVSQAYQYDDNGNITSFTGKLPEYNEKNNRMHKDGARVFTYDYIGRIKTINSTALEYDLFSNMKKYGDNTYSYDAYKQRIRKTEFGETKYYVTSGPQILAEYSSHNFLEAEYVYAGNRMVATLQTYNYPTRAPATLRAESYGLYNGTCYVILSIDGTNRAIGWRGYNLVVIDENTGLYLDNQRYDTHGDANAADAMANYINDVPQGRIVLVGITDEGSYRMNENAYQALESLGSLLCRDVGYRDSHASIGAKGALPGTLPEKMVANGSGPATAQVFKVDCEVESAGFDDGNYVYFKVNGQAEGVFGRGHDVVVIDEETGVVLNENNYDTHANTANADAMATFINGLPNGRIVLAAVKDDGSSNMTESAKLALESIGSAHCRDVGFRDSWAIIGVKGAAQGSVVEKYVPRYSGRAVIVSAAPSIFISDHFTEGYKFFYQDQIGSTREVSNSSMERDYLPYGETTVAVGDETGYQFSGKEFDGGIGLHYFGRRYYDPGIGRFLTPDPLADLAPDMTSYHYCHNNPLNRIDPDGMIDDRAGHLYAKQEEQKLLQRQIDDNQQRISPVDNPIVTSEFGTRKHPVTGKESMHKGIDLRGNETTPVKAPANGKVIAVKSKDDGNGAGNRIHIRTIDAINEKHSFFHLSTMEAKQGQSVKRGETIGQVGNTGRSAGPHLHYEIRVKGNPVNPRTANSGLINAPTKQQVRQQAQQRQIIWSRTYNRNNP
ncbi:MAG: peptidoglycan DD-metalloendopeptidase family protein [candidate division Zixibacteria bacterium]|nr:peptidoglycan DD-metalloendopeptidase family protein [candidate division Zixibacteria bacterium]